MNTLKAPSPTKAAENDGVRTQLVYGIAAAPVKNYAI